VQPICAMSVIFFQSLLSHPIITLLPTIPFPFWFFFSPLFHILPLQFLKFFLSLFNSPSPHLLFYLTLLLLFFQLFISLFWLFFWPHYSTHYRYNSSNHSSPCLFFFSINLLLLSLHLSLSLFHLVHVLPTKNMITLLLSFKGFIF
jgi:hypothetical protein